MGRGRTDTNTEHIENADHGKTPKRTEVTKYTRD
jgi:hypothetical protein